jgi:hypothetical protein
MKCQFEEKQFEQHLNNELLQSQELLYVPGQVLEGHLGFDAAIYSTNRRFWRLFDDPYFFYERYLYRSPPGIMIDSIWWDELDEALSHFPRFRFNVFIQHKRPEYLTTSNSNEWTDWGRPYYRYELTAHQQIALERLESLVGPKAIVVYASPAFVTLEDLWDSIRRTNLIDRSNFCQAGKLHGHNLYTYTDAGNLGKGHSDAEELESYNFINRISQLNKEIAPTEDNRSFLVNLSDVTQKAISEVEIAREAYNNILDYFGDYTRNKTAAALIKISAFNFVVGTRWLVSAVPDER